MKDKFKIKCIFSGYIAGPYKIIMTEKEFNERLKYRRLDGLIRIEIIAR